MKKQKTPVEYASPPTMEQLQRLQALAMIAWGEDTTIRFGYRCGKKGDITVYVKQARRGGNHIEQTGSSSRLVVEAMEKLLLVLAVDVVSQLAGIPVTPEKILSTLDLAIRVKNANPDEDASARVAQLIGVEKAALDAVTEKIG